jgi:hypothetical protein
MVPRHTTKMAREGTEKSLLPLAYSYDYEVSGLKVAAAEDGSATIPSNKLSIVFNSPSVELVDHWLSLTGELSPVRAELEGYS